MNALTGIEPKPVKGFKGLWNRSSNENVPEDHLSLCNNCIFPGQDLVGLREGTTPLDSVTLAGGEHVISYFPYSVIQSGTNVTDFLYLTDQGRLIDGATNTVLGTFTGGANPPDDIAGINIFGRCFISLKAVGFAWNNASATDSAVHYFDGTTFAPIGGVGPALGAPTLTQPSAGVVTAGVHTVSFAYYYKYGYISPPNPTSANITSDGSHNIHIAGLPTSYPTNVLGIVPIITTADTSEYFFIPLTGSLPYITTATYDFNSADTALLDSADYLFNLLTVVPNGAALKFYHGRLVVVGGHGVENIVLFSQQLIPEAFDAVNGIVTTPIDFVASSCNSGVVLNDTFYIFKVNGTYSTQDNGNDPATWTVTAIDAGLGGFDTGISAFGSNSVDILDNCLVISPRGLMMFTGAFQDTPLSYKIDALWKTINTKTLWYCQIGHDIWNKRVYVAANLGSVGGVKNTAILMMDYQDGLSPTSVKWSVWTFAGHTQITKILQAVYLITGSGNSNISQQLTIVFGDGNQIFTISSSALVDSGSNQIVQEVRTAALALKKPGWINMFIMFNLSVNLAGTLIIQYFNADLTLNYSARNFTNNPVVNYTDLSIDATDSTIATSAAHPFTSAQIGRILNVTSGTGFLAQQAVLIDVYPGNKGKFGTSLGTLSAVSGVGQLLTSYSGVEIQRFINLNSEKLIIKLANDANSGFTLNEIDLYGNPMWMMRPALSESA